MTIVVYMKKQIQRKRIGEKEVVKIRNIFKFLENDLEMR